MTATRKALYRAVCTTPDEDTPRLAFADLLDEEGESARAEFIRAQIALSRLPDHDPSSIAIRQKLPDALTGHGMAHTLSLLPKGYAWSSFEFRRGFPWKVGVVSAEAFDSDGAIFAAAPIRALDAGSCDRAAIEALAEWPHLGRIHRLDFTGAELGAAEANALGHSPGAASLTELALDYNGVTPDGLEAITRSPLFSRLTALDLTSCAVPPALIVDALGAALTPGPLTRLSLAANRLDGIDLANVLTLPAAHTLRHLNLSQNSQISMDDEKTLARSGVVRNLETLDLCKTYPGVAGIRALVETGSPMRLRSLNLAANRLGPLSAKWIAGAKSLRRLRVLNLASNPIGDSGAAAIADSPTMSGLLVLDLADTEISDAGAMALAKSPYLGGIIRLDLRKNSADEMPLGESARRALKERFGDNVLL